MARETERGGFVKQDTSEPADIAVYNDNIDRIDADVMSIPFSASDPPTPETWPGKLILQDSGDPLFFLPDLRVNKADNFWERAISGSWQSYTPATANITVGNGTLLGRFVHVGSILHCEILLIWGSTTAFTGGIAFGAPSGYRFRKPTDHEGDLLAGIGSWTSRTGPSDSRYKGRVARREDLDTLDISPRSNEIPSRALTAAIPNTWENGDKLHIQVSGEAVWS